jgi:hypothetical protein
MSHGEEDTCSEVVSITPCKISGESHTPLFNKKKSGQDPTTQDKLAVRATRLYMYPPPHILKRQRSGIFTI